MTRWWPILGVVCGCGGPGTEMVMVPKFTGIPIFDGAKAGGEEAAAEFGEELVWEGIELGEQPPDAQVDLVRRHARSAKALLLNNFVGPDLDDAARDALEDGVAVVSWDSALVSADAEHMHVALFDIPGLGDTLAESALRVLGTDGGRVAVLGGEEESAFQQAVDRLTTVLQDPAYAAIELVETTRCGSENEVCQAETAALRTRHPDLAMILAVASPATEGAADHLEADGACDDVQVAGITIPDDELNAALIRSGCLDEVAWTSFEDVGYATFYAAWRIAESELVAAEGESFDAGRLGTLTLEADPDRNGGLRVIGSPWVIWDASRFD